MKSWTGPATQARTSLAHGLHQNSVCGQQDLGTPIMRGLITVQLRWHATVVSLRYADRDCTLSDPGGTV